VPSAELTSEPGPFRAGTTHADPRAGDRRHDPGGGIARLDSLPRELPARLAGRRDLEDYGPGGTDPLFINHDMKTPPRRSWFPLMLPSTSTPDNCAPNASCWHPPTGPGSPAGVVA
jgi:hypothetical protein